MVEGAALPPARDQALSALPQTWRRPLRGLLLAHGVTALVLLIGALPARLAQLHTVCPTADCPAIILVAADVAVLQQLGIGVTAYAVYHLLIELVLILPVTLLWLLIYRHYSHVWVGALTCAGLAHLGVLLGNIVWAWTQQAPPVAVLSGLLGEIGAAALLTLLCVFPDGRFEPRWTRWVIGALLAAAVPYGVVIQFVAPGGVGPLHDLNAGLFVLFLLLGSSAQVIRYRREHMASRRRQTKWVVGGILGLLLSVLLWFATMELFPFAPGAPRLIWNSFGMLLLLPLAALFPTSLGLAILRHRLWAIDVIVNRALVYAGLTAAIMTLYTLIVGGLGALLRTGSNVIPALLAAALLAVIAAPLQARLQRAANRLLYGRRDDPFGILTQLGVLLAAADDPARILPAYAATIADALQLPAVTIWTADDDGLTPAAHSGTALRDTPLRLPLVYYNQVVGYLACAPRTGEDEFSPGDRRLLTQIATQTAGAVSAVRFSRILQESRARLVAAREEERRRLRRDLHDGLGPVLASQGLKLSAAHQLMDRRPETARQLLAEVLAQNEQTVGEVRRLIYGLRPPTLDELGLVGAIAQEGERVLGAVRLTVSAVPTPLPALPAAVEVAAYRIALEALTNVARHAQAGACRVTLTADEGLTVVIEDDGIGLPELRRVGVGLHSMHERSAELGGSCAALRAPGGGTRIVAMLPLPKDDNR